MRAVNPLRAKAGWQASRRAAPHCTSAAESCIWTRASVHTPQLLQTKSGRGSFHHLRVPGVHEPRLNFHLELEEEQGNTEAMSERVRKATQQVGSGPPAPALRQAPVCQARAGVGRGRRVGTQHIPLRSTHSLLSGHPSTRPAGPPMVALSSRRGSPRRAWRSPSCLFLSPHLLTVSTLHDGHRGPLVEPAWH